MSKKKYYSPEFKQEAVRLAEASGNKSQRGRPAVARDLGIHATVNSKVKTSFLCIIFSGK